MEDTSELEANAQSEMQALTKDAQPVQMVMSKADCFVLVGALHLVLRHPHLPPATRKIVSNMADQLTEVFVSTPSLHRIAKLGRSPEYDVPRTGGR